VAGPNDRLDNSVGVLRPCAQAPAPEFGVGGNTRSDGIAGNFRLDESIKSLQDIVRSERLRRSGGPLSGEQKQMLASADRCRLSNIRDRVQPILASFAMPTVTAEVASSGMIVGQQNAYHRSV